ncbi:hypothetical protein GCM10028778_22870 [Barrientosiimonas marina]|uniref:PIN domain-containing protein n=1 Tax=Lentibacillus kimchii TaxID=1542911 RepID=A0ABW2UYS3_9BACI
MVINQLKNQPILFDASVLLVGVDKQDETYNFENMKSLYIHAILNHFENILIHETVMDELDEQRRKYVEQHKGHSITIVSEGELYGRDAQYTTLFNTIANFDLFKYVRLDKRDKGDVFSLAYAAYYNIPFISARDGSIIKAVKELIELEHVDVCGFEHLLLLGFLKNHEQGDKPDKRYKSIYKTYCTPAIKAGEIPPTFNQFVQSQFNQI